MKRRFAIRSSYRKINLSKLDYATVTFTDDRGTKILVVDFDRGADPRPIIRVSAVGREGEEETAFVLFDVAG